MHDLLRSSVSRQLFADVPVGTFLSGGIDSSLVTALAQSVSSDPINTFTIGFDENGFDEAPFAKSIARYLGTNHTELYLSNKDIFSLIDRLPHIYDEPFADSSQLPTLLISRLARSHVTVALTGDGGDELFVATIDIFSRTNCQAFSHISLYLSGRDSLILSCLLVHIIGTKFILSLVFAAS